MKAVQYHSIEEIRLHKEEVKAEITQKSNKINSLWHEVFMAQKADTKGEQIANLIGNSITAIDAFLMVRKLLKSYGSIFGRHKKK